MVAKRKIDISRGRKRAHERERERERERLGGKRQRRERGRRDEWRASPSLEKMVERGRGYCSRTKEREIRKRDFPLFLFSHDWVMLAQSLNIFLGQNTHFALH